MIGTSRSHWLERTCARRARAVKTEPERTPFQSRTLFLDFAPEWCLRTRRTYLHNSAPFGRFGAVT